MANRLRTLLLSTGVASTFIAVASPTHALTFNGYASGVWGTPHSTESSPQFTGVGDSLFTWGTPNISGRDSNQLAFQGSVFDTATNALFKVGELTYFNGTIRSNTGIASVPLNFEFMFDNADVLSQVFSINFDIVTTPNIGTPEDNADAIVPTTLISEQSFNLDGLDYTLQLVGFSQDGGVSNTEEFRVLEEARTTASLFGRIIEVPPTVSDPSRIPEPRAIAGLGVLALALGLGRMTRTR
ncbi:MAG: choice-of-anchor K domain-containing protein [Leptolyngbyaceae bacterium]|nr:choice-of-anchor K domain-containing protein [Leptolyngbyaceae bacterium]